MSSLAEGRFISEAMFSLKDNENNKLMFPFIDKDRNLDYIRLLLLQADKVLEGTRDILGVEI